jgi:hypothetical protein
MEQDVLFWIRSPTENDHTYDFAFQLKGVVGPDDKFHVVIDHSQLGELSEVVETLRESYEQHQDREEESKVFNQEGGLIIVRH